MAISNPINTHEKIIAISTRVLSIKTGIVIFVGNAARFVTNDAPIDTIAIINKYIFVPARRTAITVKGVIIQP